MNTAEKFAELDDEYKGYCYDALQACKVMNDNSPDNWERIVNFYYEDFTALPNGWFPYWEY